MPEKVKAQSALYRQIQDFGLYTEHHSYAFGGRSGEMPEMGSMLALTDLVQGSPGSDDQHVISMSDP
jgi:hypothetical protein